MKIKLVLLLLVFCITLTSCNLFVKQTPDITTSATEDITTAPPFDSNEIYEDITSREEYDRFVDQDVYRYGETHYVPDYFTHFVHLDYFFNNLKIFNFFCFVDNIR